MLISSPHNLNLCSDSQETYFLRNVFEAVQKTRSRGFIGSKTTRLRLVVLNPIKHSCSFFKHYIIYSSRSELVKKKMSSTCRQVYISKNISRLNQVKQFRTVHSPSQVHRSFGVGLFFYLFLRYAPSSLSNRYVNIIY